MSAFLLDPRLVKMAKRLSANARMAWMHLITYEDIHRVPGLMACSVETWAVDVGLDIETARAGVADLAAAGLLAYDDHAELLSVPAMPALASKPGPTNVKGWYRAWRTMPDSALKYEHRAILRKAIAKSKPALAVWVVEFDGEDHGSNIPQLPLSFQGVGSPRNPDPDPDPDPDPNPIPFSGSPPLSGSICPSSKLPDPDARSKGPGAGSVYESYTDSWYERGLGPRHPMHGLGGATAEREPVCDDEDQWRAEFGATEPPEPAMEPMDRQEFQEAVEAITSPWENPAPRKPQEPLEDIRLPADLPEIKTAPAKPEAVQGELLPTKPAELAEIPAKRPWAVAVKGVSDFRRVQDEFQRRFVVATGGKPDWADGVSKTLKSRVDRHGAEEVMRRIANAFDAPPRWFEGVPTVRAFCSNFDSFVLPSVRAGPANRRVMGVGGEVRSPDELAEWARAKMEQERRDGER